MNEEEIKAIIFTKHFLKDDEGVFTMEKKETQTLLNLIEKQKAEIEKKDKIIAEIIEEYEYNARINFKNFCEDELRKDKCIQDCRNCAIEYFENKVKESK